MAIRNFYINGNIDGRRTTLSGGPQSKEGGMSIVITQRDNSRIVKALTIDCYEYEGDLHTVIYDNDGNVVYDFETER